MNSVSKFVLAAGALAVVGAGAAIAAADAKKSPEAKVERMIKRLDVNKDGVVSTDEVKQKAAERFAEADKDGDGKITRAELAAAMPKAKPEKLDKMMKKYDKSGDGTIDKAEVEAKLAKRMAKFDKNGDGSVTKEEAAARLAEKAAKKAKKAG